MMSPLSVLRDLSDRLTNSEDRMPVLFIGHGSPMNGIEDNVFSREWSGLGRSMPRPKAVLCISAHWLTRGTAITAMEEPRTIHDFGGFPQPLYEVEYPAPGQPALAKETAEMVHQTPVTLDHEWGLDHGTWTVVRHMYPEADIPVLQLSIDLARPPEWHYALGRELVGLREKGVLLIGSGNMVHNLRMVAWDRLGDQEYGFDWALDMNELLKDRIREGQHQALIDYPTLHPAARLAVPTPDHYYPLLYTLGATRPKEEVRFFNDRAVGGSLTMTSVQFG